MTTPIWLMKIWGKLKIAGLWLKGHWLLIVLVMGMLYVIVVAKNKSAMIDNLMKELREQQAQNSQELNQLRQIQQDQIFRQQEINAKYNEVLDRIQRDYQEQLRTMDVEKEMNLRHIIATNKDDPAAMARDINTLFGIPIYPTN